MNYSIDKPLAIIKVHTTGLDTKNDRIVSISIRRIEPDGKTKSGTRMVNPECDIPREATAIHGITNDMVENEKTFDQMAKNLFDFMADADVAGFNVRFDIEMLMGEFARAGLDYTVYNRQVFDLYDAYVKLNPRNFHAAVKQYVNPDFQEGQVISAEEYVAICGDLSNKMFDARGGMSLQETMNNIGVNTKVLDIRGFFVLDENNRATFGVGKHKGKLVADVLTSDTGYYDWMKSDKSGLPKDVLHLAEKILKKAKSVKA